MDEKKLNKYFYIGLVSLFFIFIFFLFVLVYANCNEEKNINENEEENEEENVEENVEENKTYEVTMMAVGDNLIHDCIAQSGRQSDGTYNYDSIFENIKNEVNKYDIAVINQETILIKNRNDISGYPMFGTPVEMADAIVKAGFDVVLSATNHSIDKGTKGITETISYFKENYPKIKLLGIHESKEEYDTIDVIEKNNIKMSLFNATYGTNGLILPSDKYYMLNLLSNKEKLINDIKTSKDISDITICFIHIGTEYVLTPSTYEVNYVNDLIDAGADIVVCSHPHVIEPYGMITTPNGNTGLVFYSCGNFMGHQEEIKRFLGGEATFTIRKTINDEGTKVEITDYDFIPLVIHTNGNIHTTYKLEDYTDELAKTHSLSKQGVNFTIERLWDIWDSVTHDGKKGTYYKKKELLEDRFNLLDK